MTEAEWAVSSDPGAMLTWRHEMDQVNPPPRGRGWGMISDRKLRLFACACCLLRGTPPDIVDSYERNGAPTDDVDVRRMTDARWAAEWTRGDKTKAPTRAQKATIFRDIVGNPYRPVTPLWTRCLPCGGSGSCGSTASGPDDDTLCPHCQRRYGRSGVVPSVSWINPTVLSLARAAYEERRRKCGECGGVGSFAADDYYPAHDCPICRGTGRTDDGTLDPHRLLVLADALEEAGCAGEACPYCKDAPQLYDGSLWPGLKKKCKCRGERRLPHPILDHLRSPGPHYRGCWSLDCIIGQE